MLLRKRRPQLHAVQVPRVLTGRLLGVRNTDTRGHHVHTAGVQYRCTAQAVAVLYLTLVEPGDGLEPDVRMWENGHRLALTECEGPEPVEETPWTDEASVSDRERARDRQGSEIQFSIRIGLELALAGAECDALLGGHGLRTS